jgi:hypothetical protein
MGHLAENADLPGPFTKVTGQSVLDRLDDAGRPEVRVAQER